MLIDNIPKQRKKKKKTLKTIPIVITYYRGLRNNS